MTTRHPPPAFGPRPPGPARRWAVLAVAAATGIAAAAAGCGDANAWRTVSGQLVFEDGRPVDSGTVKFAPAGGGGAWPRARIDHQGRFNLVSYRGGDRIPHGEYAVVVVQGQLPLSSAGTKRRVAAKHGAPETTGVHVRVGDDTPDQLRLVVEAAGK